MLMYTFTVDIDICLKLFLNVKANALCVISEFANETYHTLCCVNCEELSFTYKLFTFQHNYGQVICAKLGAVKEFESLPDLVKPSLV